MGSAPNYGYTQSSATIDSNSVYHAVVINGLVKGQVYYFRPVSNMNGDIVIGQEMLMTPVFSTVVTEPGSCEKNDCPVCEAKPPEGETGEFVPGHPTTPVVRPPTPEEQKTRLVQILNIQIESVEQDGTNAILINGKAGASSKLKMIIY